MLLAKPRSFPSSREVHSFFLCIVKMIKVLPKGQRSLISYLLCFIKKKKTFFLCLTVGVGFSDTVRINCAQD